MLKKCCLFVVISFGCSVSAMDQSSYTQDALIAEAFQSEAVFTHACDQKPVVATYGCGPCVAVGGYDSVNRTAFVVHFATPNEVIHCGNKIIDTLLALTKKTVTAQTPILIYLKGGHKGMSEMTLSCIKTLITLYPQLPMKIGSEDTLCYDAEGKSLLIDSRTGEVGDYDPLLNPDRRKYTRQDKRHVEMSYYVPNIRIAYTPS